MIAAFWVAGDSMQPTIGDGDLCVADLRRTQLTNPGIYAMVFEGEGLLKRAAQHLETKAVTLISDNDRYPPQTISRPDQLKVVGRIIASVHRH
jgi:phage repressor protein C with HTH and peptisase S24 domain